MSKLNIAGMDIATTSGFCVITDDEVRTATFRASAKKNILANTKAIDISVEGQIARQFEDFVRSWLIENEITHVAIEAPLPSEIKRRKRVVNEKADFAGKAFSYQESPGTSMSALFRAYGLEMVAGGVCSRLNIPAVFISQGTWRKDFLGTGRPKDSKKECRKVCEKLGIKINSADAAEAVGVAYSMEMQLVPVGSRRANDLFSFK